MSMNVVTLKFQEKPIRMVDVDGNSMFVFADVCKLFDVATKNSCVFIKKLPDSEYSLVPRTAFDAKAGRAAYVITLNGLFDFITKYPKLNGVDNFKEWLKSQGLKGQPTAVFNPNPPVSEKVARGEDLTTFLYQENQIRTVLVNGEPWFVATDVCRVLDIVNTTRALSNLSERMTALHSMKVSGRTQNVNIISEAGLYKLIFQSRKPEAEKFTDWVAEEVIPTIRKHGIYATDKAIEMSLQDPDYLIGILQAIKEEREKNRLLLLQNQQQKEVITELEPKAEYFDNVLQAQNGIPITTIAKEYGMTGQGFNLLLKQLGIIFKVGKVYVLHQKYANRGYTVTRTHSVTDDVIYISCLRISEMTSSRG